MCISRNVATWAPGEDREPVEAGDGCAVHVPSSSLQTQPRDTGAGQAGLCVPLTQAGDPPPASSLCGDWAGPPPPCPRHPDTCADFHRVFWALPREGTPMGVVRTPRGLGAPRLLISRLQPLLSDRPRVASTWLHFQDGPVWEAFS